MAHLKVERFDRVRSITFDWPATKNSLTESTYANLTEIFDDDAKDDSIVATLLTGRGEYFTSGNNLSTGQTAEEDYDAIVERSSGVFRRFVASLLDYPKLLIAVVNGPAIGIGVTLLPLCDIVYASDRATFSTPFVRLGLVTEACSSFTFANVMGKSKAGEMLLLGHKMSATEAYEFKLISCVIPHSSLARFVDGLKREVNKLPIESLMRNKRLMRGHVEKILRECNETETRELQVALHHEDFFRAMAAFVSRKNKL